MREFSTPLILRCPLWPWLKVSYPVISSAHDQSQCLVRSFGTEDRPTDRPVAPRDEVYEYIIFRGSDIKDIRVCEPPKPQATLQGGLPNDPAIVKVKLFQQFQCQ